MKNQFFYVLLTTFMLLFMGQGYAENHPPMDNDGMGGCPLAQEQCDCIEAACPHEDGKGPDPDCFMTAAPECGVPAEMMEMGPGPDGMPPCPEGDEECMKGMHDGGMPPCPEGDEECMKGMHDGGMPPCPEGDEECMKGMHDGGMPP
ncbi:MAG: hypothetical protein P8L84_05890, partial [Methylococcaceae bacterium]|nr:hypothetical protein [Methylococcaceae bacterium]